MCSCSLFFTAAHFHLGGRKHFSFSHLRYKIFMFFFFQRSWSPLFLISRSSLTCVAGGIASVRD